MVAGCQEKRSVRLASRPAWTWQPLRRERCSVARTTFVLSVPTGLTRQQHRCSQAVWVPTRRSPEAYGPVVTVEPGPEGRPSEVARRARFKKERVLRRRILEDRAVMLELAGTGGRSLRVVVIRPAGEGRSLRCSAFYSELGGIGRRALVRARLRQICRSLEIVG
jgi:hypothetical protein